MYFTDPTTDTAGKARMTTHDGLAQVLATRPSRPRVLTRAEYRALDKRGQVDYDRARIDFIGAMTVNTRQLTIAKKRLRQKMAENHGKNGDGHGLIIAGQPMLGKTHQMLQLMRFVDTTYGQQYPHYRQDGHVPVVYIETPTGCTPRTLMSAFARFLGMTESGAENADSVKHRVVDRLNERRTQLVVVDDLQNLTSGNKASGTATDVLRQLHLGARATFMYAGTGLETTTLFDNTAGKQLSRRFTTLRMSEFNLSDPESIGDWRGIIKQFEDALPLVDHVPGTLVELAYHLHDRTGGALGSLAELISQAAISIIIDPDVTIEAITNAVLADCVINDDAEEYYARRKKELATKKRAA